MRMRKVWSSKGIRMGKTFSRKLMGMGISKRISREEGKVVQMRLLSVEGR